VGVALLLLSAFCAAAQNLPENFARVLVAGNISTPTAMAFLPDGRIFVCEQTGAVRVIKDGVLLPQPFLQVTVMSTGERGLLGVAIDPDFEINQFVYVYYTVPTAPRHNRISRFTADGDVAAANSEVLVLRLDNLSSATNHNGGAIHFGLDGKLYVAIGDNATRANAQNLDTYHGKFLRINSDGSVPEGNPFTSGSDQKLRVWAYGLRNPYTFSIHPESGRIMLNEVGQVTWEEINDATVGGQNFGWPDEEGMPQAPGTSAPVLVYSHGSGDGRGCAITGGTFFSPSTTNYPPEYHGKYFYQDYCNGWINYMDPDQEAPEARAFATGLGPFNLGLTTGPDGNLYYLSREDKALYKIVYMPPVPAATITAPEEGSSYFAGEEITFSGAATDAKDGDLPPEAFEWSVTFHHENSIEEILSLSGVKEGSFVVPDEGVTSTEAWYRIVLTVTDSDGLQHRDTVNIVPRTATLHLNTEPEGLQMVLDGETIHTPVSVLNVQGMKRVLNVISPQIVGQTTYQFDHWIHGGEPSQAFRIPDRDTTLVAVFSAVVGVEGADHYQTVAMPNPVTQGVQNVEVTLPSEYAPGVTISIVDMLSRELARSSHTFNSDQKSIMVSVEHLANGMYHMILQSGKRRSTVRLLVSR